MKINMPKPFFLTLLLCAVSMSISAQEKRQVNGHEYVDLGLSVKWATCNIGATRPSEFGEYYVWRVVMMQPVKTGVEHGGYQLVRSFRSCVTIAIGLGPHEEVRKGFV